MEQSEEMQIKALKDALENLLTVLEEIVGSPTFEEELDAFCKSADKATVKNLGNIRLISVMLYDLVRLHKADERMNI